MTAKKYKHIALDIDDSTYRTFKSKVALDGMTVTNWIKDKIEQFIK